MENNNELIERPSWWKRNWKWAVPVGGCLTIIIVGIIILLGGVFALTNKIKTETNSDTALRDAQQNTELISIIGEPIESNGFGSYNISIDIGVKTANSTVPIKGPNGTAIINISTRKEDEKTVYEVYMITIDDSDRVIDLKPELLEED
ncbi:cytochrome c oxidase assembly factor Coa1 family protein [Dokdonia sp. Hel_I_53]|uniref:cytochrome c oxidase assembly factor Coa1 family protein n=1 Tax=Dokdonia sp. Hel_I_53 TaxID=1566287 RepID=UPI00119A11A9|nr:cytochrome c oxidase assembly factor Coa1 family protein [Dokdonia sp. Hel_I_53]TVZ52427.1 cytochrome oxidase complex assembly protein 1 [Dokdonia sp. Hel_I_53]